MYILKIMSKLKIIAGPCSVDEQNIEEIYQISELTINGKKAISGTRVVGLKSRTVLNPTGEGMGLDGPVLIENNEILTRGGSIKDMKTPPSITYVGQIMEKTDMLVATEIMMPHLQLPHFEKLVPAGRLMPWNSSVDQLGWHVHQMAEYCRNNGWNIGIKNGKWVGTDVIEAETEDHPGGTPIEKTWGGLAKYAGDLDGDIILIQRGVDVPEKGDHRNLPIHNIAKRVKREAGNVKLYFDPSHAYGPVLKDNIVDATIEAMKMQYEDESYIYDGILIETGTSSTDTGQHISIEELKHLVGELSTFRELA